MNNKAKVLTLITCGLTLLMAFPSLADSLRKDHQKQTWQNKHDDSAVKKAMKRVKEANEEDQNNSKPAKKDKSEKQRQKKRHQEKARSEKTRPTKVRPTTRVEKRDHDRPATRLTPSVTRDVKKRHVKPVATVKRPKHRITYSDRTRHNHRYIRGPWYSTRYITPLPIHRHKIGHRINVLPRHHVRIIIGGFPYFYYTGVFYRPYGSSYIVVTAPIGAFVRTLPVGFIAFTIGFSTYYHVNDTYYVWDEDREGYLVVAQPVGATEAIEKATTGRLVVYPKEGQSDEQQAKDRYECHRWAVTESGIDPTLEEQEFDTSDRNIYRRAIAACLEGRGYTVK